MATYLITIPDELIPGIVAISYAESTTEALVTPEDVVQNYAIAAANKACQDMQVGPYWVMPQPAWNQDGTPYQPPAPPAPEGDETVAGGDQPGE